MERTRLVTLVVVDREGEVVGATEARSVSPPWWQSTSGLTRAFPEIFGPEGRGATHPTRPPSVLRLVAAQPDETGPMGGSVTYLVQLDRPLEIGMRLRPRPDLRSPGEAEPASAPPHPHRRSPDDEESTSEHRRWLRAPWAEAGGPWADLDWVGRQVEICGPSSQHRTWNLSAIWSIPTPGGPVWLKCIPPFFAHEPTVLAALADHPVPEVLAAEEHRLLLAPMAGEDGYDADADEQVAMVDTLVDIQSAAADLVGPLVADGVPDLRTPRLTAELTGLVTTVAPESPILARLIDELPDRLASVETVGLPDTVVHGDPHSGNARRGVTPPIWFDWGDSFIGNPLLDLGAVHRMPPAAIDRWIDRWSAVAGCDLRSAWDALAPVALLRTAWVYQRFLDNIETSEQVYHRADVPAVLARVQAALG